LELIARQERVKGVDQGFGAKNVTTVPGAAEAGSCLDQSGECFGADEWPGMHET
jgi:hypothetical protein